MDATTKRILTEELWRSVVWAGLGLVGWAIVIDESARLDANALTVLGLPLFTWAGLTVLMFLVRLRTGTELQVRSEGGLLLTVILGIVAGGFAAVFLILEEGYSATVVGAIYVATSAGTLLWVRYVVLPRGDWNGAV